LEGSTKRNETCQNGDGDDEGNSDEEVEAAETSEDEVSWKAPQDLEDIIVADLQVETVRTISNYKHVIYKCHDIYIGITTNMSPSSHCHGASRRMVYES